jgi:hypothetical protein
VEPLLIAFARDAGERISQKEKNRAYSMQNLHIVWPSYLICWVLVENVIAFVTA